MCNVRNAQTVPTNRTVAESEGANVVSRYFRIGKSNARIKKKERRSTHDHKATKHIQLRERWQFVDNCYTEGCGENEHSKGAFQQTVSESKRTQSKSV